LRARAPIRDALAATLARPLVRPHVAVAGDGLAHPGRRLVDPATVTLDFVGAALAGLLREITMLAGARRAP